MCGGAVLLREVFDSIHSPANLPTTLSDPSVERQLREARLTSLEWNCLYPSPGVYGKSSDFDISLIFKLLRTICNLTLPPTGWYSLPNDVDHTWSRPVTNKILSQWSLCPQQQFGNSWWRVSWPLGKISEALLRIVAHLCPKKQNNWKDGMEEIPSWPFNARGRKIRRRTRAVVPKIHRQHKSVTRTCSGSQRTTEGHKRSVRRSV